MIKKTTKELLRALFLFQGVGEESLDFCLSHPEYRECYYVKGETIFDPHHYQPALGIVLSGQVKAEKDKSGQSLPLRSFGPGEVFGAASLFGAVDYVTRLDVVKDCRIAFLTQRLVEDLIARDVCVSWNYIHFLSDRIRFLNAKIDSFTAGNAECRLACYLLTLLEQGDSFLLPCSLSELAQRLDIGRASLYRALDALESSGAIKRTGHHITVLNQDRLSEISNHERMETK